MAGERYYGIDFGGSNLRISEVNPDTGDLIGRSYICSLNDITTNEQLNELIFANIPEGVNVGVCAAGKVNEDTLVIEESPNSGIKGEINFARDLSEKGRKVVATNDMKAAVQAVAKYGEGKKFSNVLMATYSSGYNCAVARDKKVVTTAEFGHNPYPKGDLFCGCGKKGHLEPYVSGNGAATMAKQFFDITHKPDHEILANAIEDLNVKRRQENIPGYKIEDLKNPEIHSRVVSSINAKHVYQAYRKNPHQEPQRAIRETQVQGIADSFTAMNSAFNPLEVMVLMGSQTNDWDILFEPAIDKYRAGESQMDSLYKPKIVVTELKEIGVVGAVAYFIESFKGF